jgi:hypothetical protein
MKTFDDWKPLNCNLLNDDETADSINSLGWAKIIVSNEAINDLTVLFENNHNIKEEGMFYSLYSKDINYRKRINEGIKEILSPTLSKTFKNFKVIYSIFVVKTPGYDNTEFFLHQDPSYTNEYEYSPLHFWIPLEDINEKNGSICLIEKSQNIAFPYRSITTPFIFEGHQIMLKRYLKPIFLKKGEALLLDPRVIHNSMENKSNKNRVAVLLGIIPREAPIISTFYNDEKIELFEFDDDYFLNGLNFYESCKCRPEEGTLVKTITKKIQPLTFEELQNLFRVHQINTVNYIEGKKMKECKMFGEPN